jgi:hypothetical protein
LYHTIHREGIFLVERATQREKGEREMKLEEVFGDGRAGKETMVSLFQGHFPLPTPPIPMISFGSSLSPLQLSSRLPVYNPAKLFLLRYTFLSYRSVKIY